MNADGSNEVRLTNNDVNDQMPAFSPNGRRIVFTSSRDGHPQIYVMDSDGSDVRRGDGARWPRSVSRGVAGRQADRLLA